jgi:hypothetical protein
MCNLHLVDINPVLDGKASLKKKKKRADGRLQSDNLIVCAMKEDGRMGPR